MMDPRNFVGPVSGGWVVYVNGQQVNGVFTDQGEAEREFNRVSGGGGGGGGSVSDAQIAAWVTGMKGGATEAGARAFVAKYGRLPNSVAEWVAFTGQGPGAPGGGYGDTSGYQALIDAILGTNREQWDEQKKQAARALYAGLIQGLMGTAATLTGPRDWTKYQTYTAGGRSLADELFGNARPSFTAPSGTSEPRTLQNLLEDLGLIPGKGAAGADLSGVPENDLLDFIWSKRPDLGPFYAQNGWRIGTPDEQRAVVRDWLKNSEKSDAVTVAGKLGYKKAAAAPGQAELAGATPPGPIYGPVIGGTFPTAPIPSATMGTSNITDTTGSYSLVQQIPLPHQINYGAWQRMAPSRQQTLLGQVESGQGVAGGAWDVGDWLWQMLNAQPRGTARAGQAQYKWGGRF